MLALLPDNTTGDISAADLRAIVTDLYTIASTVGASYPFEWVNNPAPASGKVSVTGGWSTAATAVVLSETTADGAPLSFDVVDFATEGRVFLNAVGGSRLSADQTGPSVDNGTYRSIPIANAVLTGAAPAAAEKVFVTLQGVIGS